MIFTNYRRSVQIVTTILERNARTLYPGTNVRSHRDLSAMDQLLSTGYEQNPSNRSISSEAHIYIRRDGRN
jgi:hypothetical protein